MTEATPKTSPWELILWPTWYDDDEDDHGYAWSGEAVDEADAVRQACLDCMADNGVDLEEDPDDYRRLDPKTVDYTDAGADYRVLYQRLKDAALSLADCMEEALFQHIYDLDNGDEYDPATCGYTQGIKATRAAAAGIEWEPDDGEA